MKHNCNKNKSSIMAISAVFICFILLSPLTVSAASDTATAKATLNISVVYMITTATAFVLLIGYCALIQQRRFTFVLLFTSVFVVNIGYAFLSMSKTLPEALLANRISYLGAVFLPLFMLLIIMDECKIRCSKVAFICLISISVTVFFIAATPGYGTLYYKDVALVFIDGGARLVKTYGPLHKVYYLYLAAYFITMLSVIVMSYIKNGRKSSKLVVNLIILVLGNILVWFIEQIVRINFEFLSISYIVTEMYLLSLYNMMNDFYPDENVTAVAENAVAAETVKDDFHDYIFDEDNIPDIKDIIKVWPAASQLTTREVEVFRELILNKKRKDIADQLCVSENTVKKHTSNIFAKLNVSSRAEILKIIAKIN